MKLEYELIEDAFDDTTQIRTMSEQAKISDEGWLLRTTVYTPHHIAIDVCFIAKNPTGDLFKPISP